MIMITVRRLGCPSWRFETYESITRSIYTFIRDLMHWRLNSGANRAAEAKPGDRGAFD